MIAPNGIQAGMKQAMHSPYTLDYATATCKAEQVYENHTMLDIVTETREAEHALKQKNILTYQRNTEGKENV